MGKAAFDFSGLINAVGAYGDQVNSMLADLQTKAGEGYTVDVTTMLNLQFYMTQLSQAASTASECNSAINQAVMGINKSIGH